MRSKIIAIALGGVVAVACGKGKTKPGDLETGSGSQPAEAPRPTEEAPPAAEPASDDPVDDMARQGVAMCEPLVPSNLRGDAKLAGERVGRMLTCKLEQAGKEVQMIMINCAGRIDVDDMKRMGGGLDTVAIGRFAYRNPFGGVSVLLARTDCNADVATPLKAEEIARAIDAGIGPEHPLVASGRLECARLIPEALRRSIGATAKLEQESVIERTVSCSLERAAVDLETAAGPTRTVAKVSYTCIAAMGDPVEAMRQRRRDEPEVKIGRGGFYDDKRTLVFADSQAPCIVDVKLYESETTKELERFATELEAALTPDLVGK